MRILDEIVDDYIKESEVDYIALPQISCAIRQDTSATTVDEVRKLSLEVVKRLYSKDLRPGNYWGSDFDFWPDDGRQAVLDRIEREWIKAGADPNLAQPICWFAPRPA
jgi:hypothetical protein